MPRALLAGDSRVFLSANILSDKLSQKSAVSVAVTPLSLMNVHPPPRLQYFIPFPN